MVAGRWQDVAALASGQARVGLRPHRCAARHTRSSAGGSTARVRGSHSARAKTRWL